jgi:hypothetical protein
MKRPLDVPALIHDAGRTFLFRLARIKVGGGLSGLVIIVSVVLMTWAKQRRLARLLCEAALTEPRIRVRVACIYVRCRAFQLLLEMLTGQGHCRRRLPSTAYMQFDKDHNVDQTLQLPFRCQLESLDPSKPVRDIVVDYQMSDICFQFGKPISRT